MRGLSLLALVVLTTPAAAGTINGSVTLVEKGGRKATDVSDVVVYVDGPKAKARPAAAPASIVMKGKAFSPHMVVVPVGASVQFPNQDPIFHNVFSVSGDNRFDLDLYKRPKAGSVTFQHPGVVKVYCNIHPQMSAVVLVTDAAYYAKVSSDGSFTIEDVPPGHYSLRAWQERAGDAAVEVTVPERGAVPARFDLDASRYKVVPHKNKFGKDYSSDDRY